MQTDDLFIIFYSVCRERLKCLPVTYLRYESIYRHQLTYSRKGICVLSKQAAPTPTFHVVGFIRKMDFISPSYLLLTSSRYSDTHGFQGNKENTGGYHIVWTSVSFISSYFPVNIILILLVVPSMMKHLGLL